MWGGGGDGRGMGGFRQRSKGLASRQEFLNLQGMFCKSLAVYSQLLGCGYILLCLLLASGLGDLQELLWQCLRVDTDGCGPNWGRPNCAVWLQVLPTGF